VARLEALGERGRLRKSTSELLARRRRGRLAKSRREIHTATPSSRRRVDGVDVDAMAFRTTTAVVYALGGAAWRLLLLYLFDARAEVLRLRA